MKGKVTAVNETTVTFVYSGEELEYQVKKSEINKIVFGSGRTQVINEATAAPAAAAATTAVPTVSAAERQGKIAVLPFDFSSNDPALEGENLENRAQQECALSLQKNTSNIVVQDPRTTNAILAQKEIDAQTIATMLPKDMALLLGVEYVMYGTLNVENKGAKTYGSEVTSYKDKEKKEYKESKAERKNSGSVVTTGNSTTVLDYDSRVSLSMYNDQGKSIYSNSREPFGDDVDAFHAALDYMIKRTPFGSKHK